MGSRALKRMVQIAAIVAALLVAGFLMFSTADTNPRLMREKYGGPPSQFVDIGDGLTVHLRDEGPRGAPAIMLLHGSNADLHTWDTWAEALKARYRVIRFDQIGHGLTGPARSGNYSRSAFAADVGAVADALGVKRFILGGNSMGGGIALEYALTHPERLDGLVLVDASGAPKLEESAGNIAFTLARIPGVRSLMAQITPRALVEKSLSQSVARQEIVTPEAVDRYWELLRYPGNRQATMKRFSQPYEPFASGRLGGLKVPTLVLWGEQDALIPVSSGRWLAERISGSTLIVYPGVGHVPMEEAAGASSADLARWLATLGVTRAERDTG